MSSQYARWRRRPIVHRGRGIACTLALALVLPSCMYVAPKDKRSVVRSSEQWERPAPGPAALQIQSHVQGTGVAVRAIWKRTCELRGERITEYRISRGASLEVEACTRDSSCLFLDVLGLFAAPVTLLVSGIFTAASVAGDKDRFETAAEPLPTRRAACDAPGAGLGVIVSAQGRDAMTITMDAGGSGYAELEDADVARRATVQLAPPAPR
jgi:hypothetical protein